MRNFATLAIVLMASSVLAQEGTKPAKPAGPSKKSLAAGLVRHCIERDKLTPPVVQSGLEIGAGKGQMALLVRSPDGSVRVETLPRGLGDHGPAAKLREGDLEEEVPEGKQKPKHPGAGTVEVAKMRLHRTRETLAITVASSPKQLVGKKVDRATLQKQCEAAFAETKGSKFEGQLLLEVTMDTPMQDVLTCWEVARSAGFSAVMFSPLGALRRATDKERSAIQSAPKKGAWKSRRVGPMNIYDGELLFLLDGPTRFGDVAPLLVEAARCGIWQLAFVGQKDAKHRYKLPTHLPSDRGR